MSSLVLPSCFRLPFTHDFTDKLWMSQIASLVTTAGPRGQNVSIALPRRNCPPLRLDFCQSRAVTSCATVYPKIQSSTSSLLRPLHVLPITIASSASQSTFYKSKNYARALQSCGKVRDLLNIRPNVVIVFCFTTVEKLLYNDATTANGNTTNMRMQFIPLIGIQAAELRKLPVNERHNTVYLRRSE